MEAGPPIVFKLATGVNSEGWEVIFCTLDYLNELVEERGSLDNIIGQEVVLEERLDIFHPNLIFVNDHDPCRGEAATPPPHASIEVKEVPICRIPSR